MTGRFLQVNLQFCKRNFCCKYITPKKADVFCNIFLHKQVIYLAKYLTKSYTKDASTSSYLACKADLKFIFHVSLLVKYTVDLCINIANNEQ